MRRVGRHIVIYHLALAELVEIGFEGAFSYLISLSTAMTYSAPSLNARPVGMFRPLRMVLTSFLPPLSC